MNFNPISDFKDVKYYDHPSTCISDFDKTPWSKKTVSLLQSLGNTLLYFLYKISLVFNRVEAQMKPLSELGEQNYSKKKLVVCIHGLNNNPSQFKIIVDELQNKNLTDTAIFVPQVLLKGNAKLDEMVKPIYKEIKKWAKTGDDNELVFVGISNGGRISRELIAKLANSGHSEKINKIRFISIVGACKGTPLVNLVNKLGLSRLISKNIAEEMPVDSKRNQQLDRDWLEGLSKGPKREYTFFASPHDWVVTNYDSTLMAVEKQNAQYAIVPGHGHNSIVNAVSKAVADVIAA